jgi:hypothetical protein
VPIGLSLLSWLFVCLFSREKTPFVVDPVMMEKAVEIASWEARPP